MGYENEPSYGNENFDHKVVAITLKSPLTRSQVDALFDAAPQLDEKLTYLGYTDGEKNGASFDHGWENTNVVPRAVISYEINTREIKVRANETISTADFVAAVKYVVSEAAKTVDAPVASVASSGVAVSYAGATLSDIGSSLDVAKRAFKGPSAKAKFTP